MQNRIENLGLSLKKCTGSNGYPFEKPLIDISSAIRGYKKADIKNKANIKNKAICKKKATTDFFFFKQKKSEIRQL